ncbi:Adenine deaminase (plasmid) [Haloterrigena turkmenica DSM 5511]|uniref:Adenine deaminase n=1 Tax=Haloterrigena turkmenica (strain ATCC 51198 / DSM 5511 / JCM 9101 / NCIMB 13204 / VKM B-1734 / 4k) TaxID=543526 RepID=D2S088_HALTV|nr:adenine deaminase [Haloterrigena turkmenica]ADB62785.1 Adenine deaminase [Haloterrigena turkmenica DSM 5511]
MTERVDTLVRGTLVNVNTGNLEDRAVAIDDGTIVALDERPAERELRANYVAPGLIDAHMHVESSMVTLPQYAEAVVPNGVTSVVHDPHEIANVVGAEGVRAVIRDAERTPLKARFTAPSSVPASDLQDCGATLSAEMVTDLLDESTVVALGEVMDVPGLVAGDGEVHAKVRAARERGLTVDGHMPRVTGDDLQVAARYLDNDHESISLAEAREKVDVGLRVYLREGSSSKNLAELLPLAEDVDTRRLSLCTDDREVTDIVDEGGVDFAVRKAIREGIDPVDAVQMATINTAESYGLPFGSVRPGAPADLVLLEDLKTWSVDRVLIDGELDPTDDGTAPASTDLPTDTVEFPSVSVSDLAITVADDHGSAERVRVIDAVGGLQTEPMIAEVPVQEGVLTPKPSDDLLSLAVIERHGKNGGIGRGFVHGLELDRGAVGSTVAHDAHNCVVAGADHASMASVANELEEIDGGVVAYDPVDDEFATLALPVAGLMSNEPIETVYDRFEAVESRAAELGMADTGLMELSFLALEVIPSYRLTNNGLVDVEDGRYVDVTVT